jgi:polysaccharide biosynthesis/export protein
MLFNRSTVVHACAIVCLCLLIIEPAFAQVGRSDTDSRADRRSAAQADRIALPGVSVPLEGALDETEYIIGPGDVFAVTIGGPEPIVTSIPVSADGRLLLPAVGGVRVSEMTLGEARGRIIDALRPSFQRVRLDVALVQPRQFYVHVSGAVPVPGRYLATPVARVSTVLEFAFADTTRLPVDNMAFRPSFRDIVVRRSGDSVLSIDLERYLSTGDTRFNPYLRDGDVVIVGTYDPTRQSVFIDGAVPFPGAYAFRDGDTVLDLLTLAGGDIPANEDVTEIRVASTATGHAESHVLHVQNLEALATPLRPLDHVFVGGNDAIRGTAAVEGWVRYPGRYPVTPGVTTLEELVAMAGGLREGALHRGIYLERNPFPRGEQPSLRGNRFDPEPSAVNAWLDREEGIERRTRLSELEYLSRHYLSSELRRQSRVSVDPAYLSGPSNRNTIYIQDGDRLVVPRDEGTVHVFGQVNRPGYLTFREGENIDHYLERAGGLSPSASGIVVIEAGTGRHVPLRDAGPIGAGDMIFVDRRADLADSAEMQQLIMEERRMRSEARFRTTQTIAQVVGTAASVLTTFLLLRSRSNSD